MKETTVSLLHIVLKIFHEELTVVLINCIQKYLYKNIKIFTVEQSRKISGKLRAWMCIESTFEECFSIRPIHYKTTRGVTICVNITICDYFLKKTTISLLIFLKYCFYCVENRRKLLLFAYICTKFSSLVELVWKFSLL